MSQRRAKIAAAPISWGVCEVPGWGFQMEPTQVLLEMNSLGFDATEFGPEGFLPTDPSAKAELLSQHSMVAVGGFVPAILHLAEHDPLPAIIKELEGYAAAGAATLVLAASTGIEGYDATRPVLSGADWEIVFGNLERIRAYAESKNVQAVLHPHVGTMVENHNDIMRIISGSTIAFCLDTGHMLIGGSDPVAFSLEHASRIAHAHLKDVDLKFAEKVQSQELTYYDAVIAGLYRPLGKGDVDIRAIVFNLLTSGYDGWFVLEQDNVLTHEPKGSDGPLADAKASVEYLRKVIADFYSK